MRFSIIGIFDSISRQSRVVIISGKIYIVKDYSSDIGLLKWYIITLFNLALKIYPFIIEPLDRLMREVDFIRNSGVCFSKPELFIVDYVKLRLIREYIRGEQYDFRKPLSIHRSIGYNLGLCHSNKWVLGDTKISNFIVDNGEIYIVDAEQAIRDYRVEYAAWDILVLVSTLFMEDYVKAASMIDESSRVIETILSGYVDGFREWRDVFNVLKTHEFRLLSYLFIPFPLNILFTRKIDEFLGK